MTTIHSGVRSTQYINNSLEARGAAPQGKVASQSPGVAASLTSDELLLLQRKVTKEAQDLGLTQADVRASQAGLSASHRQAMGVVAGKLLVDPAAGSTEWGKFCESLASDGVPIDPNALVQEVLRESYQQTTEELRFHAEKVKFFNALKKSMREEMKAAQNALAEYGGKPDETVLKTAYRAKEFDSTYHGDRSAASAAIEQAPTDTLLKIDGVELKVPPSVYQRVGFFEAMNKMDALHNAAATFAASACTGATKNGLTHNLYYFLATNAAMKDKGANYPIDQLKADLAAYGLEVTVDTKSPATVAFADGTKIQDSNSDGQIDQKDMEWNNSAAAVVGALGIDKAAMPMDAASFEKEYGDVIALMQTNGLASESGKPGHDAMIEVLMIANSLEKAGKGTSGDGKGNIFTKAQLDAYVKNLEEKLNSVGDDAQLANVDLQNTLQKQQQTMQMLSNISKMLHDTTMAIVRKIGG